MKNYFDKLQNKVNKLKNKYATHPRRAALKFALWNLKCVFKNHKTLSLTQTTVPVKQGGEGISPNILRIAIAEGGGLGDALFQTTYIKEIRKMFHRPVQIDFYCRSHTAFLNCPFIDGCFPWQDYHETEKYDVYIISRRFYIILKMNADKVKAWSLDFYNYCKDCRHLTDDILNGEFNDNLFSQYALIYGKNRLEQANVHDKLPVTRHTPPYLSWDESAFAVLDKFRLKDVPYITVSRACSSLYTDTHPKLWPLTYYHELIQKIKKGFPTFNIIQIGANGDFGKIDGIDLDLRGQTSLDETKCLLKYAVLHIDGEGGLVHIRRFVNGKSVVLFGPTDPMIFGYDENINLRTNACPYPCEWVTPKWTDKCLLNGSHVCMRSLSPDIVFKAVSDYLSQIPHWTYTASSANLSEFTQVTGLKIAHIFRSDILFNTKNTVIVYDNTLCENLKDSDKNCNYLFEIKENGFNAEYAPSYNIPVHDNTFDLVWCAALDHVQNPEYTIREALRILKDGGQFVFAKPLNKPLSLEPFGIHDIPTTPYASIKKRKVKQ